MRFPLELRFKTIALAPQLSVTDAAGQLLFYVRQKAFKLKEAVTVFADEGQTRALYRIDADRIIDFSARYRITDASTGAELGVVQRRGMRSIWRAHYEIQRGGATAMDVREENPWIRVLDGLMSDVPVLGMFTGYAFHPAYRLSAAGAGDGAPAMLRMVKRPALFEGRYEIERPGATPAGGSDDDERLAVLGLLMIVLLERVRG